MRPSHVTKPTATPTTVLEVAARVDARLARLLDEETARWAGLDADLAEPLARLRELVLAGGKRLRPTFCHWGFVAAGGDPDDEVVAELGAAFELLHAFALIHDDVVDDSDTRRGRPALHASFAARHRDDGLRGEQRRFGEGVAVLIGDLAHVYADVLVGGLRPDALALWNELRIELNVGQYLDVLATAQGDTDPGRAHRIARYKSAKYTIERPLHLGAAVAGGLGPLEASFTAYGIPLGEAFQLRDDLLGVFGDASVTGKPVGDDLREGKPTPLLSLAVARAGAAERTVLEGIGRRDLGPADIVALQEVFVSTGARDAIEDEIGDLRARAIAAIGDAPIDDTTRAALVELAWFVTARER